MLYRIVILFLIFRCATALFAQDSTAILDSTIRLMEIEIAEKKSTASNTINEQGVFKLTPNDVNKLPRIMGETDWLKSTQFLTGVQSGNEGALGFFVRGGSPDQNLLLYDNIPILNATHLYGFLSTINGEAIEQLQFHKNYVPATKAGRLATAMEIDSKNGNNKAIKTSITLGIISAKFSVDGPIKSPRTTFSIYGRGSFLGAISQKISKKAYKNSLGAGIQIAYYFYDLNANIQHTFNGKHQLKYSFFLSHDFYNLQSEEIGNESFIPIDTTFSKVDNNYNYKNKLQWMNIGNGLTWNYLPKEKWRLKNQLLFSNYSIRFNRTEKETTDYLGNQIYDATWLHKIKSFVRTFSLKSEIIFTPNNSNRTDFGLQLSMNSMQVLQSNINFKRDYKDILANVPDVDSTTGNSYPVFTYFLATAHAQHEFTWKQLELTVGFNLNFYQQKKQHYTTPEGRFKLQYKLPKQLVISGALMYTAQHVHLLNSRQSDILYDVWLPTSQYIKPQTSLNFSGSIHQNIKQWQWSIDAYYRKMFNQIDYKNNAGFLSSKQSIESQIYANGIGKAYGVEFFVAKSKGNITASARYNLAWSTRQFDSLNNGQPFYYKFDKRHDLALMIAYRFKKHFDVSLTWVFNSGQRTTIPKAYYYTSGEWLPVYANMNDYVLPKYHRMDISFNYTKETKQLTHQFNFSIFNLYSRQNVFSVYTKKSIGSVDKTYYQLSLFPILPSLSYTITIKANEK